MLAPTLNVPSHAPYTRLGCALKCPLKRARKLALKRFPKTRPKTRLTHPKTLLCALGALKRALRNRIFVVVYNIYHS